MDLYSIKRGCNDYLNSKKGYAVEIDNYSEDTARIYFDVRVFKNGAFRACQSMNIRKMSELTAESQFRSQIERFSAMIINKLI